MMSFPYNCLSLPSRNHKINTIVHFNVMSNMMILFIVLIIVAIFVFFTYNYMKETKQHKERMNDLAIELKNKHIAFVNECDSKYGTCDMVIRHPTNSTIDMVRFYREANVIVLNGRHTHLSDYVNYEILDEVYITEGKVTAQINTDTGSLLGRAVLGSMLGGSAGMVIGGLTAKKTLEINQEPDTVTHTYYIIFHPKDDKRPDRKVFIGWSEYTKNRIVSALDTAIFAEQES